MSFRDKVRDQLYGSEADEAKNEESAAEIDDFLKSQDRPYEAPKTLLICLLIEGAIGAAIFFAPRTVWSIATGDGQAPMLAIFASFGLGFMIAFTAYKFLRSTYFLADPPIEGVMSEYSADLERESQMRIWFISVGGGVFNAILLFALLSVFS